MRLIIQIRYVVFFKPSFDNILYYLPVYINDVTVGDAEFLHRFIRFPTTHRRRQNVEVEYISPILGDTSCKNTKLFDSYTASS